ncbi:MAG: peptidase prolyl oligopeptidase active site region [Candidatus Sulfotelmatobacter sp.]|nr:peptidase prolyl oligopeptidase active site region [Candidatus Sulfotelmatobacter sp.]
MRHLIFSLLAFIAITFSAIAQAKHPFTFEDMMKLKRVGEPQVSPDGKWVIFSVVDVNLEANTKTPHIWIVPTAGGQEKEIIADQDADRPRWSPGGRHFAFVSTKDGGSQIWVADFDAVTGTVTGVRKLTSIGTGASGELWSPDGKNILFTSDVYPQCDGQPTAEASCNARTHEEQEKSKVKALTFTSLLYRHWNAYKESTRTHIFVIPSWACAEGTGPSCSPGEAKDLTPGDYDAPVFSLGGQDNYAFSPDGQEICYTSNHDKNPAASTNNDLWIVPVDGFIISGNRTYPILAKNITTDNPASDSTPLYSPDRRYIAYRAQQRPGYESDRFRLMLYDRKTGEKKDLTEGFDHWVGTFVWTSDSKAIAFSAEHEGHSLIYALDTESAKSSMRALVAGFNDDLAVTPNGKTLLFTRMSVTAPIEIYASDVTGAGCPAMTGNVDAGKESCSLNKDWAVTHVNDSLLSQVSMTKIESFLFTGANGEKVEGFLVKPPNFDPSKKYPVKFLIHGGPQGAWGDDWSYRWNPELFAAPTSSTSSGYVVIMINFHGSTGYGQKFIDAINGDWGGAPFEDLMKGLDYAEKTYPFIDKDRECALGASYGGYMANWILGHTDRFKCIVSHDGMFNAESAWGTTEELWFNNWEFKGTPYDNRAMYQKWSPHQYAKNFKTPTLVIHGQRDYRLDVSEGLQLFTTLQMEGVPSKMLYFPDEGHWVQKPQNSQLWYKTVNDWVDQWTKK